MTRYLTSEIKQGSSTLGCLRLPTLATLGYLRARGIPPQNKSCHQLSTNYLNVRYPRYSDGKSAGANVLKINQLLLLIDRVRDERNEDLAPLHVPIG